MGGFSAPKTVLNGALSFNETIHHGRTSAAVAVSVHGAALEGDLINGGGDVIIFEAIFPPAAVAAFPRLMLTSLRRMSLCCASCS